MTREDDGRWHVTDILKAAGLIDATYFTDFSRDRGSAMHKACEYMDGGDLDPATLDPSIQGRVAAYARFLQEMRPVILAVEESVTNEAYQYVGTLDRRMEIGRRESIVDLKGPYPHPATALQTAGYAGCFPGRHLKRYGLHLSDDGTYKLIEYDQRTDWPDFLACLRVAQLKRRWKI